MGVAERGGKVCREYAVLSTGEEEEEEDEEEEAIPSGERPGPVQVGPSLLPALLCVIVCVSESGGELR